MEIKLLLKKIKNRKGKKLKIEKCLKKLLFKKSKKIVICPWYRHLKTFFL